MILVRREQPKHIDLRQWCWGNLCPLLLVENCDDGNPPFALRINFQQVSNNFVNFCQLRSNSAENKRNQIKVKNYNETHSRQNHASSFWRTHPRELLIEMTMCSVLKPKTCLTLALCLCLSVLVLLFWFWFTLIATDITLSGTTTNKKTAINTYWFLYRIFAGEKPFASAMGFWSECFSCFLPCHELTRFCTEAVKLHWIKLNSCKSLM